MCIAAKLLGLRSGHWWQLPPVSQGREPCSPQPQPCEQTSCSLCSTSGICWVEAAGSQVGLGILSLETEELELALTHLRCAGLSEVHGPSGSQASGMWARACQEVGSQLDSGPDPVLQTCYLWLSPPPWKNRKLLGMRFYGQEDQTHTAAAQRILLTSLP